MPKKEIEKEKKPAVKKKPAPKKLTKIPESPKVEAPAVEIIPPPAQVPVPVKKVHREKKEKISGPKYYGTGRRKTSVARVYLSPGSGKILVNGRPFEKYICGRRLFEITVLKPLRLTNTLNRYDVQAKINGGGIASQMGALKLGIARALNALNPDFRKVLKKEGLLKRDPRMKERKKYGQKRARKRFQYSKR